MTTASRRPTARNDLPPGGEGDPARPSKTRLKREMEALQTLGETLVALDPKRLRELDLPERLADALSLARDITKHEARRRQMQYVGRLMREVDPAPIRAALERWETVPRAEKARFAALEGWRDRLVADAAALDAFVAQHPDADRDGIARLAAAARSERSRGEPPRAYRELFRALKRACGDG